MRINNNVSALNAWRNLTTTNTAMGKSLEKLSSGFRINRAADDASGLVISQSLRAQISGLKQATRNSQDGISVVQTAEGALNEVHTMLNRMRDLAVQAANTGTVDITARKAAQAEFAELRSEIDRIASSTSFGSQKLLNGKFGTAVPGSSVPVTASAGSSAVGTVDDGVAVTINGTNDDLTVTIGGQTFSANVAAGAQTTTANKAAALQTALQTAIGDAITAGVTLDDGTALVAANFTVAANGTNDGFVLGGASGMNFSISGGALTAFGTGTMPSSIAATGGVQAGFAEYRATFQVGAYSEDTINISIEAINAAGLSLDALDVSSGPSAALETLDDAIDTVSTLRGKLGAVQNRFESTIANLQVTTENLVASESRIRDVDMASEMTNFTKQQVLIQAGTAMLGQANSLSQSVLSLLQ